MSQQKINMKIEINAIEIRVKILDDKKTKAIITLDFRDFVIKGFRVQESKYPNHTGDNLWLTPPSYQGGGRYHPMFFMPDKTLWEGLSMKIWERYYKASEEHHKKKLGIIDEEWASIK